MLHSLSATMGATPHNGVLNDDLADAFAKLNVGMCSDADREVHFPDAAVRSIATYLVQNEPPGHALIHLLAFCGVCRQWRNVAHEVNPGVCIGFDVLENTFCSLSSIQRFRRLSMVQKEEVFCAAAELLEGEEGERWLGCSGRRPVSRSMEPNFVLMVLVGYTEVLFCGEAVSDRLVAAVAQRVGSRLTKVKLQNAKQVTDVALCALVRASPLLQSFTGEEMERAQGAFAAAARARIWMGACCSYSFWSPVLLSNGPSFLQASSWYPSSRAARSLRRLMSQTSLP